MQKNDEVIIDIIDVTSEGYGIGRYNSVAVFVPLSAVGDRLKVTIVKVLKNYCFGKIKEILIKSDCRINADCEVFNRCGGCAYRHITYEAECKLKQSKIENAVKRIGKTDLPIKEFLPAENITGYRNKAQYPVSENGNLGFYALHSHRIIENTTCNLQPEIFTKLCNAFSLFLKENNISIYNMQTNEGLVRHFYLRYAEKTNEIMAVIVINGDNLPKSERLISDFSKIAGESLKCVAINVNKDKTNVILGKKCITLYGDGYITDIICGVKIRISPLSFYQVNRTMAEKLYLKAAEYAKAKGKTVLDLYCGVGAIGLSMANSAKSVIGVEIVPDAVSDAKINAEINGIKNARFICADASFAAKQLKEENIKADVIILDPPRKGCDRELLETVATAFCPERIVYVSCDSATFARDCEYLSNYGYSLKEHTGIDLFPRTSHVETVGLIVKNKNEV